MLYASAIYASNFKNKRELPGKFRTLEAPNSLTLENVKNIWKLLSMFF